MKNAYRTVKAESGFEAILLRDISGGDRQWQTDINVLLLAFFDKSYEGIVRTVFQGLLMWRTNKTFVCTINLSIPRS